MMSNSVLNSAFFIVIFNTRLKKATQPRMCQLHHLIRPVQKTPQNALAPLLVPLPQRLTIDNSGSAGEDLRPLAWVHGCVFLEGRQPVRPPEACRGQTAQHAHHRKDQVPVAALSKRGPTRRDIQLLDLC